jgi:ubiquinone/menaquinone biosynthesis C-methylase UbiE
LELADLVISILKKSPADQYSLYQQTGTSMSKLTKTIAGLQQKKIIHVAKYRKSERTGLDVPVYSLVARHGRLDVHGLLAGVTSERLVEYDFVARNLKANLKEANVLDVGAARSELAQLIHEHHTKWQVLGIDLEPGSDAVMDARSMGFRDGSFDQVISVSAMEHIGLDDNGDTKTMKEIFRVLKKGGSAIITVPCGKANSQEHRVYDRKSLAKLAKRFKVVKKEFYKNDSGKWVKCSQAAADKAEQHVSFHFNAACACLLLRKQ